MTVWLDKLTLLPTYLPNKIEARNEEIDRIWGYGFRDLLLDPPQPTTNLHIFGRSGSGKTLILKTLINKLRENLREKDSIFICYGICGNTSAFTLANLLSEAGVSVTYYRDFRYYWTLLTKLINNRPSLIVLDEADKFILNPKDNLDLLYSLSRETSASVITTTNRSNLLDSLRRNPSVASSYRPMNIVFRPYNFGQLFTILNQRVQTAFQPTALPPEKYIGTNKSEALPNRILTSICKQTEVTGDVRYGLNVLYHIGMIAETYGHTTILDEDYEEGLSVAEYDELTRKFDNLTISQKVYLLAFCKKCETIRTPLVSDVNIIYRGYALNYGLDPSISERRFAEIRDGLTSQEILGSYRKGRGRGKGTDWCLTLGPTYNLRLVQRVLSETLMTRSLAFTQEKLT